MYQVIFSFFFTLNLWATEIPFKEFFEFVEKDQSSYFSANFLENSCSEGSIPTEKFNLSKCVASICGTNQFNIFGQSINPYMVMACIEDPKLPFCKEYGYQDYYEDLGALRKSIKEYFPQEQKFTEAKLKAAKKFFENPQNINSRLDSLNLNLSDLFSFIFSSPEFIEAEELEEGGIKIKFKNIKVLKKKLRGNFNLRKSEVNTSVKALKVIFEDSTSIFALQYFGVDFVIEKILSPEEMKTPLQALRARKFAALKKIKETLDSETIDPESIEGSYSDQSTDLENLLLEVLALEPLSQKLSKSDLLALSKPNFTRVEHYMNPKFSPDWKDPNNKDKFLNTMEHIENQLEFFEGGIPEIDDYELNAYMSTILNSMEILPTTKELEKAKVDSKAYLDDFFKSFKKEFSEESTLDIQKEVGSLHINYSESKKDYLDKIKKWLEARKGILRDFKKLSESENKEKGEEIIGRGLLQDLMMGSSASSGQTEFVEKLGVNPIPDLYLGAYNGIKMGPLAVKDFSNKGKQILAHELGHHVGHFMEKHRLSNPTTLKFKDTRECLAKSHGEESLDKVKMKLSTNDKTRINWTENMYSEEDFADWIAAKASDSNMACLFVKNLKLDDPSIDYFKNSNEEDPHSSAVFRLLNIELNKTGSLPDSCQTERVKLCPKVK